MKYQPNQSIVDYNDWLPEGNWVDLGYDNAPTEDQLRSQIEAGEHNDAYGDLGCPDCGNVDLFWKTHSSKGQRYRCLSCEYSSNWETVKSQGDLTLQKFGLTVDCPLCSETISAYNRASIDSHFRKHKKEEAEAAEAAEASEPKVSESEWQEEVEWNDKPKKKTEPEWEDVEWEAEAPEQPRKCCECSTTEGLTTIQAGTFCWDCLPINLGAESSQEIKEYITSIHDGDFLWRDGWDNLEFTLQTLPMEIFEEYKDTDNVDGAWEDSPVNSHRLEDTLSQFRWEGDRYPPVVLKLDKNGYYDIIDGYHRLNALQILDYDTVEAWVGIPASTFEAEDNYDATYGKKQAKIRRRLKNKIMKQNIMGTKANKWTARKSQELKRQYEKACEKAGLASYKGSKTAKQDDLSNWSKQKWTTASGKKSSVTGEPYFPEKAVAALKNRGLYAKAKRQKRSANKANRNARYSDDIREVVGQFRAEEYLNPNDPEMINILLLEWAMKTNQTYDSLTIQKGLANYIDVSPYYFVRHMQDQDLISLKPAVNLGWNALVPADFLYYLQDKDRDHWVNMKARAVGIERYKYLKEKISADRYWLSDSKKDYHRWSFQSAINYQNI